MSNQARRRPEKPLRGGFSRAGERLHGTARTRPARPLRWTAEAFEIFPTDVVGSPAQPSWDAIRDKDFWCRQEQVIDMLRAAEEDREPYSSGKQLRWVEEMIHSIYISHLARARVPLPLKERVHPLG